MGEQTRVKFDSPTTRAKALCWLGPIFSPNKNSSGRRTRNSNYTTKQNEANMKITAIDTIPIKLQMKEPFVIASVMNFDMYYVVVRVKTDTGIP
jgi:hypothetical protein